MGNDLAITLLLFGDIDKLNDVLNHGQKVNTPAFDGQHQMFQVAIAGVHGVLMAPL